MTFTSISRISFTSIVTFYLKYFVAGENLKKNSIDQCYTHTDM